MNNIQDSLLRLLDALTDKLDQSTLDQVLTQARLTEHDFSVLKADIDTLDIKDSSVEYILENFDELNKADIKGLHVACFESLDLSERQDIAKKHIDSLWFKAASDKPLMLELHEILDSDIDIAEEHRNRVANLEDTLGSILDELQDDTPDYAKIIKWVKSDLEIETKNDK